ncbi:hypothetical protein I3843_15G019700 [Carya illinoinensis]|nr:hypothetical protein I3843_15G019700 [Carya illinoinensis]
MNNYSLGSSGSPKSFHVYPRGSDFDLELGTRRARKPKNSPFHPIKMLKPLGTRLHYYCKLHPLLVFIISLSLGVTILIILSLYESHCRMLGSNQKIDVVLGDYPLPDLRNLVMVAVHSVYTSSSCGNADKEDSWFLESYQKNPGQASTFVKYIQEGVEIAAKDDAALLLFSGGETRKDAGPRSEAQSYWSVAESRGWFGKKENMRWRALTEEHARDSFENLLFSVSFSRACWHVSL